MQRVLVLGRGAAGKSTAARRLAELTGLPLVELDAVFWQPGLQPTPAEQWRDRQLELTSPQRWIMDGDLGPYDQLDVRLAAADTIIVLDFPLWICLWRALGRGPERGDFWRWLLCWRRRYRPALLAALARRPSGYRLVMLRSQRALARFLNAGWPGPGRRHDAAAQLGAPPLRAEPGSGRCRPRQCC